MLPSENLKESGCAERAGEYIVELNSGRDSSTDRKRGLETGRFAGICNDYEVGD